MKCTFLPLQEVPQSDGLSDELAAYPKAPAAIFESTRRTPRLVSSTSVDLTPPGGSGMVDANACRTHEWHSGNLSPPNGSRPIMRCFKGISLPGATSSSTSFEVDAFSRINLPALAFTTTVAAHRSLPVTIADNCNQGVLRATGTTFFVGLGVSSSTGSVSARPPSLSDPVEK